MHLGRVGFAWSLLSVWLLLADSALAQETFYVHPTNTLNGAPGTDIGSCAAPDNNDLSDVLATTIAGDTGNGHTLIVCNSAAAAGVADYTETAFMNLRDAQFLNLTIQGETGTAGDIIIQGTSVATHADVFRVRRDGITIQDLRIQGGTNAIQIYANGPDATIDNVEIASTDNDSILIQGDGATIDNVLIIGSATSNDGIQANAGATNLTIQNSTIRDTQVDGIQILETGAVINNVIIEDAGGDGIQLSAGATNADLDDITVQIDDAATSTGADCINILATGVNILTAVLDDCGARGIDMNVAGAADVVSDITVNRSANNGIYLQSVTGGTFTDISIVDAENDGLSLNAVSGVTFNVSVLTDNLITNAGDAVDEHGIEIDTGSNNNTFEDFNITNPSDDGINLNNADDNDFTRTDVTNAIGTGSRGIVVNATSTGNTFTNIVVDNTTDDCIAIVGDDTTITGANTVVGDGATLRNCGDFGITATTNPGTLLSLTSILTEVTVVDDGIFIDNYTGAVTLGDVSVTGVDITSPVQGFTISDSVNVQATDLTIDANNQPLNILNSSDLEITDFTLSSTVADGIQLNNVDDSRFAGNSSVDRSSLNGIGNGNNDQGITLITGSDGNTFEFIDIIDTEDDAINIVDSDNNTFNDIDITNPTYVASEGIFITDALSTGNDFSDVTVDNVTQNCFRTLSDDTTISDSTFSNCDLDGVLLDSTNAVLDDVSINTAGSNGIQINATATGAVLTDITIDTTTADGILISSNDADLNTGDGTFTIDSAGTNGIQIAAASTGSSIQNVTITSPGTDGVLIVGTNAVLNGVTVEDATGDGIQINNTASNTDIDNLTVQANLNLDSTGGDCVNALADTLDIQTAQLEDCGVRGLDLYVTDAVNPTGTATINDVTVVDPGATGVYLRNLHVGTVIDSIDVSHPTTPAGDGIEFRDIDGVLSISNLTSTDAADDGIIINFGSNSVYSGTNVITDSDDDGLYLLNGASSNSFSGFTISSTGAVTSGDGIYFVGNSDSNTFDNFVIQDMNNDGVDINPSSNNTFTNSEFRNNGVRGVRVRGASNGNIFNNNLFLENGNIGLSFQGTGVGAANQSYENCFRNSSNIQDTETGHTNVFVSGGRGSFYGSISPAGTGFSETCLDDRTVDDDICDSAYSIPGAAGSSDASPLQSCTAFFTPNVTFSKTVLTIADPINGSNYKAIPGGTVMYTVTATNGNTNEVGMAEDATITDDFTNEITTTGTLSWNSGSMDLLAPEVNGGVLLDPATDAIGDDEAEFDEVSAEPDLYKITARCGDLNAGESCVLNFTMDIQ